MNELKYLGNPAPEGRSATALKNKRGEVTREEHLEGAVKEAARLFTEKWSFENERRYVQYCIDNHKTVNRSSNLFSFVAFLLRKTIGEKE
jgi:hypothetical protein